MAITFEQIASTTLTSTNTTINFNNITGTYTDLLLRMSVRDSDTSTSSTTARIRINGDSNGNYSSNYMAYSGSIITGNFGNGLVSAMNQNISGSAPAMTGLPFAVSDMYIANYASTTGNKVVARAVGISPESASASTFVGFENYIWASTSAITSIEIVAQTLSFAAGSSFYLYGIKKA